MRAAAVQLQSTPDRDRNLAAADRLTRDAAAAGAELVVLPEKWPALGTPEQTIAAAEPFDGPILQWAKSIARELGIDLVAGSFSEKTGEERGANTSVHVGPDGELQGELPQDPHVRRRGRRPRLQGVRARGAGRGDRALADRRRDQPRPDDLLRRPLPRALPDPRRARRRDRHRARRVHVRHHARPLGGPAARPRDRGPGVRRRRQPDRRARAGHPLRRALDDRRPVGRRARDRAGHRDVHRRRARPRAPGGDPPHACPRWPTAGPRPTAGPPR